MRRFIPIIAVATALLATPALAGNKNMKHEDGSKLRIACTGSGCTARVKPVGGKWGVVERAKGGTKGYEEIIAKYEDLGYK